MRALPLAISACVKTILPTVPLLPPSFPVAPLRTSTVAYAMSTSANSSGLKNKLRVVSYNVLSSKLAQPSHFTHTNPEFLVPEYRLNLILKKLEAEMYRSFGSDSNDALQASQSDQVSPDLNSPHDAVGQDDMTPPPTIFCLQEIDYYFTSALHTFFANHGYHFVTGLYGYRFNGYMGIGIAYPLKDFNTVKVDVCRLSDERDGGWPRPPVDENMRVLSEGNEGGNGSFKQALLTTTNIFGKATSYTFKSILSVLNIRENLRNVLGLPPAFEAKKIDPWDLSEKRTNVLLTVLLRFQDRNQSSGVFSISNYHMPCKFDCPPVMTIHAEMVARRVQKLASGEKSDNGSLMGTRLEAAPVPYILAGDFNILPNSAHYSLLTKSVLDVSDPSYPPSKHGTTWERANAPMDSAYTIKYGNEPEFTNYAHVAENPEPFIGTLDYIFLSPQKDKVNDIEKESQGECSWKVHSVLKLPPKELSGGPYPNEVEPSDHLLISADLELRHT